MPGCALANSGRIKRKRKSLIPRNHQQGSRRMHLAALGQSSAALPKSTAKKEGASKWCSRKFIIQRLHDWIQTMIQPSVAGSPRELSVLKGLHTLSPLLITVTLANFGHLWALVCVSGYIMLFSECVMPPPDVAWAKRCGLLTFLFLVVSCCVIRVSCLVGSGNHLWQEEGQVLRTCCWVQWGHLECCHLSFGG